MTDTLKGIKMAEWDVSTIATICLAIAAIIGIFFAANEYRHLARQRKLEMLIRIYPGYNISRKELRMAEKQVVSSDFRDFSDFISKYGAIDSGNPIPMAFDEVGDYYEGIGILVHRRLVDSELVYALIGTKVICYWEKMLPFTQGLRKSCEDDSIWEYFEYLYHKMQQESSDKKSIGA
jgi:hypothetical protein